MPWQFLSLSQQDLLNGIKVGITTHLGEKLYTSSAEKVELTLENDSIAPLRKSLQLPNSLLAQLFQPCEHLRHHMIFSGFSITPSSLMKLARRLKNFFHSLICSFGYVQVLLSQLHGFS